MRSNDRETILAVLDRYWLTPELRAGLDAVLAKWAAPGMCNPDDQTATVAGEPTEDAKQWDGRSTAQRNHDALKAGCEKWHTWEGVKRETISSTSGKEDDRHV